MRLKSGSIIQPLPVEQGAIAIVAILANPAGPEEGTEWFSFG